MNKQKQPGLHVPTRIVFGVDAIDLLGDLARECEGTVALIVSDEGVAAAGHVDRAARLLRSAGLAVSCFNGVDENPTTEHVDACCEAARTARADLLVGLGGGSPIDTARGCNFILTSGGRMADYWGVGKATAPMLPMIAIPTTTGTGSETQSFALIEDSETRRKMACGDKKAAARIAILDPTLSATQPRSVIGQTGLDCIAHAIESDVCTVSTDCSRLFSRESWRLAAANVERILQEPGDLAAQGQMLLASAYAGIAIEHSMLGIAHSLANPLTATFGLAHGRAVGIMLPAVMKYNANEAAVLREYACLARLSDASLGSASDETACAALIEWIDSMVRRIEADRPPFPPAPIDDRTFRTLSESAADQWTAQFNPRAVDRSNLEDLYRAALCD